MVYPIRCPTCHECHWSEYCEDGTNGWLKAEQKALELERKQNKKRKPFIPSPIPQNTSFIFVPKRK